jgi:hypothetical protein
MRRRVLAIVAVGVVCTLGAATSAAGDGGPAQGAVQGWDGLARGAVRYVAVPTPGWTSVQVIKRDGGRVIRFMNLKGSWGIPLVAFDGGSDALLRDDRTLVLGEASAGPVLRKHSSFVFLDTWKLRVLRRIQLNGHFAFDAVSPDARYLYVTEYVSQQNFARYRVRAVDLRSGRLLPKIVSDRSSWETTMEGMPISRVNREGWAYTLYGGTGARPFIHALDTRHVEAVCIDLPWKHDPRYIYDYRLRWDTAGHLVVRGRNGRALVTVDRKDLRVLTSVRNP